jgi:hypothetical protein
MKFRIPRLAALFAAETPAPKRPALPALHVPRLCALIAIATLVAAASLVSFAESYRGLYLWSHAHGLVGFWSAVWPLQVDVFICIGELALFVGLADQWAPRSRYAAWTVTASGLAVSVAGNIGHALPLPLDQVTAAVPPLAAAASLAVGLGVLKRIVASTDETESVADDLWVPENNYEAAYEALRATLAAGNGLSQNQLSRRFNLTRAEAHQVRTEVLAASNGHPALEPAGE